MNVHRWRGSMCKVVLKYKWECCLYSNGLGLVSVGESPSAPRFARTEGDRPHQTTTHNSQSNPRPKDANPKTRADSKSTRVICLLTQVFAPSWDPPVRHHEKRA